MTYNVGGTIQAADYNGFVGSTAVNSAYPDGIAATNKVAALIGVGYATRGYGQTSTTLGTVTAGNTIYALEWNNLRSAMATMNTHQGSSLTLQPSVAVGDVILAEDGSSGRPNISSLISTLDSNRLNATISQMSLTNALTSTRTASWNYVINHVFTVAFSSEDEARYYFNTGGQIRCSASHTGGSGPKDTAWTSLLAAVGVVKLGATNTTSTGGGTPTTIGYYNLTGGYQQIFIQFGVSGIFYSIQARRESFTGVNGGNGSLLRFNVTFNDAALYYYYYYGSVTGTISSQIDQYKAAGVLSIASPTFTTITPL